MQDKRQLKALWIGMDSAKNASQTISHIISHKVSDMLGTCSLAGEQSIEHKILEGSLYIVDHISIQDSYI